MPEATDPGSGGQDKSVENALSQMIWGYRTSQAILVAVRLGIPDRRHAVGPTS